MTYGALDGYRYLPQNLMLWPRNSICVVNLFQTFSSIQIKPNNRLLNGKSNRLRSIVIPYTKSVLIKLTWSFPLSNSSTNSFPMISAFNLVSEKKTG
jgi:hypothetical protein